MTRSVDLLYPPGPPHAPIPIALQSEYDRRCRSSSSSSSTLAAAAAGGEGSTSTITTSTTTGWHELKIPGGYSTTKEGNGKGIDSIPFTVGGHTWYIKYYPDGNNDKSAGWVSIYLYLVVGDHPSNVNVKAKYKFTLISDDDVDLSSYTRTCSGYSFWSPGKARGFYQFVKSTDMEASLKGHAFRVRCDVTVVKETCVNTTPTTTDTSLITIPPPDLHHHLGVLLDDTKVGGDVSFTVSGERFVAHKYVLAARSPVLMAELFGPMKENTATMSSIQIHDVEPSVFRAMLRFIYTDSMPEVEDDEEFSEVGMAQHLLVAADKYGLQRLKAMCEVKLLELMDVRDVATTMTLAEQHGCEGLKEGCFRFMRCPGVIKAVMASEGFQHLRTSCPFLIEEMLAKLAP
nr:unnamed protein product [Digitaria exilis]